MYDNVFPKRKHIKILNNKKKIIKIIKFIFYAVLNKLSANVPRLCAVAHFKTGINKDTENFEIKNVIEVKKIFTSVSK